MKRDLKKSRGFFWAGLVLVLIAAGFLRYAFGHPEASFPWDQSVTDCIYALYMAAVISLFYLSLFFRRRAGKLARKKKEAKP